MATAGAAQKFPGAGHHNAVTHGQTAAGNVVGAGMTGGVVGQGGTAGAGGAVPGSGGGVRMHNLRDRVVGEKYRLLRLIGYGSFGEIYRAMNLQNGEDVAVKIEPV